MTTGWKCRFAKKDIRFIIKIAIAHIVSKFNTLDKMRILRKKGEKSLATCVTQINFDSQLF